MDMAPPLVAPAPAAPASAMAPAPDIASAPEAAPVPAAEPAAGGPPASGGRRPRPTVSEAPTCVLRLASMATRADLADPDTYQDILDDVAGAPVLSMPASFSVQESCLPPSVAGDTRVDEYPWLL